MIQIFYLDNRDNTAKYYYAYTEDSAKAISELVKDKELGERDYYVIDIKTNVRKGEV